MSSAPKKTPLFKYFKTQNVPALPSIQTEWDLASLYYKDEHDPRIEADLVLAESAYERFAKHWRGKDFTQSPDVLKKALEEYEALSGNPSITRPGRYFGFRSCLDTADDVAEKQLALMSRRLRKASDNIIFFPLALGKLSKAQQRTLLRDKSLAHFRYYLECLFKGAAHHLSEAEEKIIRLKGPQSYGLWTSMTEKILSNRQIAFKGKTMPFPEAIEHINTLKSEDKPKLWSVIIKEMEQIGEVAEHEFNAIITDVRTEDELRGYKKPYSATVLSYEDNEQSLESLVSAVSDIGFTQSQKFYTYKAAWHGKEQLHYSQKYDSIGEMVNIPFAQAVDICRDVFYGVNNIYGEIFDTMLVQGQIDVYPKKGKTGGAFMSDSTGHPTHVLLNHVNNFKSLETLAHEMGHAIHARRSSLNTPLYDGHSIITAETASTLFENLVFDAVYAQVSEEEKAVLLHERIAGDIATIERQIAFFNAELEIHNTIFTKGAQTNEELAGIMYRHLKSYLGPAITLEPKDGYSYVYIPHLRYGFYVYTYSFGLLMSTIMAARFKADRNYAKEIDTFLTAGSSASVADIFARIGIDTTAPDVFVEALKDQTARIAAFGKSVQKRKKQ